MTKTADIKIPRPRDAEELADLLELFIHHRFGSLAPRNPVQAGLDAIVRDTRAGEDGNLWAFALLPHGSSLANLDAMTEAATSLRRRPDFLIAITVGDATSEQHDYVHQLAGKLRRTVELWDWPVFADRLAHVAGAGPWLDASARVRERRAYCDHVMAEYETAPATMPLFADTGQRLANVWLPRQIRIAGDIDLPKSHAHLIELAHTLTEQPSARAHLVALLGLAGIGKTASMLEVANKMATLAREDKRMPLPMLVSARELLHSPSAGPASPSPLSSTLGADDHPAYALWRDPMSRWLLLLDGCDEVAEDKRPQLYEALARLRDHPRVTIVIMAMRSDAGWPHLPAQTIRATLVPWSGRPPGEHLLLMDALVQQALPNWQPNLRRVLERYAWESVRRGNVALSPEQLLGALATTATEAELAQARASLEDLALFGPLADGRVEFVDQRISDTLASCELARRPDDALLAAATLPRTHEAARLAILRRYRSTPEALERLIHMLLRKRVGGHTALMRLALATRVAADLGERAAAVTKLLSRRLVNSACHPASPWIRSIGGELLLTLAQAGGPVWERARQLTVEMLERQGERAAWFETHVHTHRRYEDTPGYWLAVLHDESPAVRVIALRKLARWCNQPQVMGALLACVQDESGKIDMVWPHFAAGLALRNCRRTAEFRETLEALLEILAYGEEIFASAAALALHPSEAPAELLLGALRYGWDAMSTVKDALADVVQPLLQDPKAQTWARQYWPEVLSTPIHELVDRITEFPLWRSEADGPEPPLSSPVRRDLGRVATRALAAANAPSNSLRFLLKLIRRDPLALIGLCETSIGHPQRLCAFITAIRRDQTNIFWPPRAQLALGRAALQSPELVQALQLHWQEDTPGGYFPGLALQPLVAASHEHDDEEIAHIYASWISDAPCVDISTSAYYPLSPQALAHPRARRAALRRVRRSWSWTLEGKRDRDGQTTYLLVRTMGGVLRALAPVWYEERDIVQGLIARAAGTRDSAEGREAWLDAALFAWSGDETCSHMPNDITEMLARRFNTSFIDIKARMYAAQRAGIVGRIERPLSNILHQGDEYAFLAASLLAEHRPKRSYRIATRAAKLWAETPWSQLPTIDGDRWERLIRYAPNVWCDQVLNGLDAWWGETALSALQLIPILLACELKGDRRAMLVESVIALARESLPWKVQGNPMRGQRIGDVAQKLIFDWAIRE